MIKPLLITTSLLCLEVANARNAMGMFRYFKYKHLMTIEKSTLCLTTSHEFNPLKENAHKKTNTKNPMICQLTVELKTANKSKQHQFERVMQYEEYLFNEQRQTCFAAPSQMQVKGLTDLRVICAPLENYLSFFPQYKINRNQLKKKIKS